MTDDLRLNLGALRSAMQLTLHTHHASRIWHGRARSEGRAGIIGLAGFVSVMNTMRRGAEQDDPYSDWWMLQIEAKLDDSKQRLKALREQVDQVLADVPPALSLGDNLNVQPVKLPLFINAQLGFLAVYLLADYDETRPTGHPGSPHSTRRPRHPATLAGGRSAPLAQHLRSGPAVSLFRGRRDDFAANNAVARGAREKYGDLPQDVLEGTRRPRFAPPIAGRSSPRSRDAATNDGGADDSASHDQETPLPEVTEDRPT